MSSYTNQPHPGGYGAPQQNPYAQATLRPLRPLIGLARAGAWTMMAGQLLDTGWTVAYWQSTMQADLETLTLLDIWAIPVLVLVLVGTVLALVGGCRWLAQARRNAELLPPFQPQRLSSAWVWWSWIVPIVSWWWPRRVVLDVWADTAPATPARRLVNRWWGFWVAGTIVGILTSRQDVADPSMAGRAVLFTIITSACLGVALHAWLQILDRITRDQDQVIGAPPPAATGWPSAG